ncbi:MAG: cytidylate kinase family protein [Candidatus Caldatribacteriaceae bacterium]
MGEFSILTISREVESLGDEIALKLSKKLGFEMIDKDRWASFLEEECRLPFEPPLEEDERKEWMMAVRKVLHDKGKKRPFVLLGRGGQKILEGLDFVFHILVVAPTEIRLQRIMEKYHQNEVTASRILAEQDLQRERFLLRHFGIDWKNPLYYNLVLNTGFFRVEEACYVVIEAMRKATDGTPRRKQELLFHEQNFLKEPVTFSHPSEEEFARILNFYNIRWLYEPRTFPLEWDSEGNVTEAFAPDFYLPDFDLFIELTTQKQKLTWKKNKKVRRLKELYPEVKIKVIYGRDYQHILRKFGVYK